MIVQYHETKTPGRSLLVVYESPSNSDRKARGYETIKQLYEGHLVKCSVEQDLLRLHKTNGDTTFLNNGK